VDFSISLLPSPASHVIITRSEYGLKLVFSSSVARNSGAPSASSRQKGCFPSKPVTNMNTSDLCHILESEKVWLADHPSMQPWDDGCHRLVELLDGCLRRYSKLVRERPAELTDGDRPVYLGRLWQCLGYHWRDALGLSLRDDPSPKSAATAKPKRNADKAPAIVPPAANGHITVEQVAAQIAAGQGYQGGGRLGGDPLRDIVLAVAMVRKDQRAPRVFQDDYYALACAVAAKTDRRLADDPDAWWNELLDHLAGYTRPKAKLDRFDGRCALRYWLGLVIRRFLCRWRFDGNPGPDPDEQPGKSPPPSESLKLFAGIVYDAVQQLSTNDRLLLALLYVDGIQNKEAAAILGIHEGTASRRHEKALPRLQASIIQQASQRMSTEGFAGILEDLRNNPRLFAQILREALESEAGEPDEQQGGPAS
jgi:RNA polymerase sigma factor (sigma-70 family)